MIQPSLKKIVGLREETNAKLLLQAEYMIFYRAFSEKGHATGVELKKAKIQHFGSKM